MGLKIIKNVCLILLAGIPSLTYAQFETSYTPCKTFTKNSKELIDGLNDQLQKELERLKPDERRKVISIYKARTRYLVQMVKSKAVIKDDTLQQVVDRVVKRIVSNNTLSKAPSRVLIQRSVTVNAFCYGEGTLAVTIGMLSKVKNESQLAFALAHELAHYELDHIKDKSIKIAATNYESKFRKGLVHLLNTEDISLEEIQTLRRLVYDANRFSRWQEEDADLLGFTLFKNAGYDQREAIGLLHLLDSAMISKYPLGPALFQPFESEKYPFREYWLNNRLSLYSKKPTDVLIFSMDSTESHPDIDIRIKKLLQQIQPPAKNENELSGQDYRLVTMLADFESVESAYFNKLADFTMMHALQLLHQYPRNTYVVSMIGKVFIQLYEVKDNAGLKPSLYLPSYTINYDEQVRLVNNFLHNLTLKEMGEVAFNFLNNRPNFNSEEEEHYYLLWKISSLTYRNDVKKEIKRAYHEKFPNGRYYKLMKDGLTFNDAMKMLMMAMR